MLKRCFNRIKAPLFLVAVMLITLSADNDNKKALPNIIIVITDDQGYGDMSCHGNPWLRTPHIDDLYKQSTRLTDFHVSPTCSPTRAALLTGHYTNRTGAWHTVGGRSLLREHEITMAQILQQNGYRTGLFGKWHLGDNAPFRPQDKGFDDVLMHGGGGVGQQPDYWGNTYFNDTYFLNGEPKKYKGYCTDVWFDNAINFMAENTKSEKPFFCYLSTNAPHSPYYVEDKYSSAYLGNDSVVDPYYYGMVNNFDMNLGKLLHAMDSMQINENTILIFLTDNGTSDKAGVMLDKWDGFAVKGYNAGMRGCKVSMYEGGHRVPLFIRWPGGGITAGKDVHELTAHIDILPTLVDLLSLKGAGEIKFDGISLKDLITGKTDTLKKRTVITDSQRSEYPVKWHRSSTMQREWRLINGQELYSLERDPEQRNDVSAAHPEIVRELRSDYEKWWEDISPSFNEYPTFELCSESEPVTVLNTMDMHPNIPGKEVPWDQAHILSPLKSQGWWAVQFPSNGRYRFTLYRWPPEAKTSLNGTTPASQPVPATNIPGRPHGLALKIKKATITVDKEKVEGTVNGKLNGFALEMGISAGFHKLWAEFTDQAGDTFSAYYVKVEKLRQK